MRYVDHTPIARTALTLAALFLIACGGSQKVEPRFYDVDASTPAGQAPRHGLRATKMLLRRSLNRPHGLLKQAFVAAEIAYNRGDVEGAFDRYGYVVSRHPDHPFARYAAARLYTLRDTVLDFLTRAAPSSMRPTHESSTPGARTWPWPNRPSSFARGTNLQR
ncbi:MAG: hypothetical protein R3E66_20585 [bacterium]